MTDKVYLVGFMASGKSTVARELAARLGWESQDLDELIEAREHQTIAEIFEHHGEPRFRAAEREMLRVLQPLRHVVVATGGGTVADHENRALMALDGAVVWLDLPLEELIPRIPLDGRRPLAASRQHLQQLYDARTDYYRQAHVRIEAARMSTPGVVERILDALRQLPPILDTRLPDA